MKIYLANLLLKLLNSRWFNPTPAKYAHVNGLDAVSYEELKNEVRMNPHKLVRDMICDIDTMRSCPIEPHVHEDGQTRPMTDEDIKDLQNL